MSSFQIKLSLLISFTVGIIVIVLFSKHVYPFTFDSLVYISTADNIMKGKGLVFSNFFIERPDIAYFPTYLQPPGFSYLIASFKYLGLNPYEAAVVIPRLCFVCLPFLFFFTFRRFMPSSLALVAMAIATFMFPMIHCSLLAWSDIPYLCASLSGLICAFRIIENRGRVSTTFLVLTGALIGLAFLIRYVGLSLIASIAAGMVIGYFLRVFEGRTFLRIVFWVTAGLSGGVLPFVWRNIKTFGTLMPFQAPPSKVDLWQNLHDFSQGLSGMLFINPSLEILLIILAAVVVWFMVSHFRETLKSHPEVFLFIIIISSYFLIQTLQLIVFKTIYFAPEPINERYLIQICWILVGGIVVAIHVGLNVLNRWQKLDWPPLTFLLLFSFALVQFIPAMDFYIEQRNLLGLANTLSQYTGYLKSIPSDSLIVTNVVEMPYVLTGRNMRMLSNYTPYGVFKTIHQQRRYVVFLVKDQPFFSQAWKYAHLWNKPQGYSRILATDDVEVFVPGVFK